MRHLLKDAALALGVLLLAGSIAAPALAQPSYAIKQETIRGRVSGFDGHYALTVRDERGYLDRVQLRDGTIINPRGLTLASGMSVTILGETVGNVFVAREIDTPYTVAPGYSAYGYYPYPPYGYPPPYYGYPYYYGPSFGLGIRIGGDRH
jgi:hypothetical protein